MPRPPRLEHAGALYHVTARGVGQAAIFLDDGDRIAFLKIVVRALNEHEARAFAFCLMGNHYHFVLQTLRPNLSALMQHINSRYSRAFNGGHSRRGHVFEGRFKAVLVDRDAYLLEACRYVDLNPVRAGFATSPAQWRWCSYRVHVGIIRSPSWLATQELHDALMGHSATHATGIEVAQRRYAEWVEAGSELRLWKKLSRNGRCLGDEAFAARLERVASEASLRLNV